MAGKTVIETSKLFPAGTSTQAIHLVNASPGLYILHLSADGFSSNFKFQLAN
jgi:hypothetical protein